MPIHGRVGALAVLALVAGILTPLGLSAGSAGAAPAARSSAERALQELAARSGGQTTVGRSSATGLVSFFGVEPGRPVRRSSDVSATAPADIAARSYLEQYGEPFGVRDAAAELVDDGPAEVLAGGQRAVRFQQLFKGVQVESGELVAQLTATNELLALSGEMLPTTDLAKLSTTSSVTAKAAAALARASVAKTARGVALTASAPTLTILDHRLIGGPSLAGPRLTWKVQVRSKDDGIRRLVFIDAGRGSVVLALEQNPQAKSRRVCNHRDSTTLTNEACPAGDATVARVEGGAATGISDVDKAYDFSGYVYDFYKNVLGRDSIDGAGMTMVHTVRHCPDFSMCPWENAFWNGTQMAYGTGYTLEDDVVGHEMTHGVTERTSGLHYYYQSGAINEALSDILGELMDQQDPATSDTSTVRWRIGEDLPIGAIRNMSNPPALGQPDQMESSLYDADPDEVDYGGVHTNSGVANKAAFLMTDGGDFNGRSLTGVSGTLPERVVKVAKIHYRAEFLLTSGSDYNDLYYVLPAACDALVSGGTVSTADCAQVRLAVSATAMNLPAANDASPPPEAPLCTSGTSITTWFDDLENTGSGLWTTGSAAGSVGHWWYPSTPNEYGVRVQYTTSGTKSLWGDDPDPTTIPTGSGDHGDLWVRTTSGIPVPAGAYLHFRHAWDFESEFDGGVVEYSTNAGSTWVDAAPLFVENGYNGEIVAGGTNPLEGRSVFTGTSRGYTSSRLNLASLAGRSVMFRFHIGADDSVGRDGWFVDDVRVLTCTVSRVKKDFNGDGRADIGVFRPSTATWWIRGVSTTQYGATGDIPVPGDYNGDGRTDIAVFRPSTSTWYVRGISTTVWGAAGDVPAPGDYNGDSITDLAIFRPSTGTWWIRGISKTVWGGKGDIVAPGDYNGDGRTDIALWRPSNTTWYIHGVSNTAWGAAGDVPVPADFNDDGRDDMTVFRPSTGVWYVRGVLTRTYGTRGDKPVPADYSGDGTADTAVFRPSNGTWYIYGQAGVPYGVSTDRPL